MCGKAGAGAGTGKICTFFPQQVRVSGTAWGADCPAAQCPGDGQWPWPGSGAPRGSCAVAPRCEQLTPHGQGRCSRVWRNPQCHVRGTSWASKAWSVPLRRHYNCVSRRTRGPKHPTLQGHPQRRPPTSSQLHPSAEGPAERKKG